MAGAYNTATGGVNLEVEGLREVQATLRRFDKETNAVIRARSQQRAQQLADAINRAARSAPAPQAHRFDGSARVKRDRFPAVNVGGRKKEGGYVNGMAVLNATEYGSSLERFHAPKTSSGYWVGPTVRRMAPAIVAGFRADVAELAAQANRGT